jgi:hypothetical protein
MPVTITASQALPGDIIRDRDGNLWNRLPGTGGQVFTLTYVFHPVSDSILPPGQDCIEPRTLDLLGPLLLMMRDGEPVGDTLPEPAPPKVVEFEWALHGGSPYEDRASWERELGFKLTDELLEKMGRPFYEVILRCSLDTETGKVEILGAK